MQPDSTLLKKAKSGDCKAFNLLIALYWHVIPTVSHKEDSEGLSVEWYQEAKTEAFELIKGWPENTDRDFEYTLFGRLRKAYQRFRYANSRKVYENEYATDPEDLEKLLVSEAVFDDTEYKQDLSWLRKKLLGLMNSLLTDLEKDVLVSEFFENESPKTFQIRKNIDSGNYSHTKSRALQKLRTNPDARWLWSQGKEVFYGHS